MTNQEELTNVCERLNTVLNTHSSMGRVKVGYASGKCTIYETNHEGGIIRNIMGGLTRREAINMLYVMIQTVYIAHTK